MVGDVVLADVVMAVQLYEDFDIGLNYADSLLRKCLQIREKLAQESRVLDTDICHDS